MRRRQVTGLKPAKAQQRIKAKRGAAPKASPNRRPSASSKETEVARLSRERDDAVEQLSATSEVLRVISRSPGELEPVFKEILSSATRVCGAKYGMMYRIEADGFRTVAMHDVPPALAEARRSTLTHPPAN